MNYESLPDGVKQFIGREIEEVNRYIADHGLRREKNKNSITALYRILSSLSNRLRGIGVVGNDTVSFSHPTRIDDIGYLLDAFEVHEALFRMMDMAVKEIPPSKWDIIGFNGKTIHILLRGKTAAEVEYLFKFMRNLIRSAKKVGWLGLCKLYRSYEF